MWVRVPPLAPPIVKMKSGQTVDSCFSTDFLIAEADEWRSECWKMIRERSDLHFIFLTKCIERFIECIPADWNDRYHGMENSSSTDKDFFDRGIKNLIL